MFGNVLQAEDRSDFNKSKIEPNENMDKMEAGYTSLFQEDGESAVDTYWAVRDERQELGRSPTAESLKTDLHTNETASINLGINEAILDPTRSLEDRVALSQVVADERRKETPISVKLGQKLSLTDNGENETEEGDDLRGVYIGGLESQMAYREMQESVIANANFAKSNTGLSMVGDIAQLIVPFVEQSNVAEALAKVGRGEESLASFFMLGNQKQEFFDTFKAMPLSQRIEAIEMFAKVAHEANTTAFMTNGLLEQQMLDELVYGGNYGDTERYIDNFVSLVDLSIIGKPAVWLGKAVKKVARTSRSLRELGQVEQAIRTREAGNELLRQMNIERIRTEVSPLGPIRVAAETNPEAGRGMFKALVDDTTDEAAGALGGSSRTDVVGDSLLPEFHRASGVRNKIHNIDSQLDELFIKSQTIRNSLDESAVSALTRAEMKSATAHEVANLKDVVGVQSRGEMFQHTQTPTGARISAVYGNSNNGWNNATDALDQTEVALRAHGVERSQMYLMERSVETGEYVRVDTLTEATDGAKDFLVGVDFNYQVKFSDVDEWENLSVTKNFLDRVPLLAKNSINRHFFDAASILDPHLTLGANAKVDRAAQITQDFLAVGKAFSDGFRKASKESQASMYKYILEANEKEIPFNINTLRGDYGFSTSEIKTLRDFREYWDTVWAARNVTDVRALRNDGYGIFTNSSGDNLFARPVGKGQVTRGNYFYDPATGLTKHMDEAELQKLYDSGHTIGKLRRPMEAGGKSTDQMILRNDAGWRALNDSDKVYPYRHGYFQRIYTKPHFIVKVAEDGTTRAIATADTVADANIYLKRLNQTDPEGVYRHRPDVKDPREQGSFEMDTFESSGMSMQRVRGERLIDSTAAIRGTEDSNVLNPVDAIIQSSRSMGSKVAMGDFIQASKARFMAQFGDQLPLVKGQRQYPRSMEEIGSTGDATGKAAADARSTYEYISFLEYGYVNSMDNIYKTILKSVASTVGEKGFRTAELGLEKLSDIAPTSKLKQLAFRMYIATNPFRQAVLNAHQSVLLTAKFTKYVTSQKLAADMHAFMYMRMGVKMPKAAVKLTGRTESELKLMWKEYQKSGLSASIDQNNLIRGSLMDMAEASKFKESIIGKVAHLPQKFGFNLGEEINMNSSWLAHYDEAAKAKGFLDATDFSKVSGEARNFTFNMNRAGDMPYNTNSLSLIFQYMQIPHKSLLQSFNRALTLEERGKLFAFNMVMFTFPPAAMYSWFGSVLPDANENPELHDAIVSGLEFYMFNKIAQLTTGEHVSMDWGNLAPSEASGLYEFMRSVLTTELGEILAATPSGQLLFGGNPRLTKFAKTAASFVTPDDPQDMSPTTLSNVFTDLASLSSGMSNFFKAKMALEYHKAHGNRGQVTDPSVSSVEAMLLLFGFKTLDSTRATWVGMDIYEKSTEYKDDVNKWYKETTMKLASEGGRADTDEYVTKVTSMAFLAFGSSQKAYGIITRNLDRDALAGKGVIYDSIMRQADVMTPEQLRVWGNSSPEGEGREQILETIEEIRIFQESE